MPPRNMNPLPGKMPNGQDRVEYTRKCHLLIEKEYKNLMKNALYQTQGDKVWAHELLHDTLLLLLEGYHNVDFNKSPVQYVRILLRHVKGRHKQIKQKDFNRTSLIAYDPCSPTIEKYKEEESKYTDIQFLLDHFHQLQSRLNARQLYIVEEYLEGKSCPEIGAEIGITSQRVNQLLLRAKKEIQKKGTVLLQGGSLSGRGL